MPTAIHSDGQIISVIENSASMAEASRQLGIELSALYKRRKRIEAKVKEPLKAPNDNLQMQKRLEATTHPKAQNLGILNGTVVIFSDAHFWPGIHTTAYRGLLWAIKELQPKAVIANGDIFDGAGISRHPRIGWDKAPTVMQELKA